MGLFERAKAKAEAERRPAPIKVTQKTVTDGRDKVVGQPQVKVTAAGPKDFSEEIARKAALGIPRNYGVMAPPSAPMSAAEFAKSPFMRGGGIKIKTNLAGAPPPPPGVTGYEREIQKAAPQQKIKKIALRAVGGATSPGSSMLNLAGSLATGLANLDVPPPPLPPVDRERPLVEQMAEAIVQGEHIRRSPYASPANIIPGRDVLTRPQQLEDLAARRETSVPMAQATTQALQQLQREAIQAGELAGVSYHPLQSPTGIVTDRPRNPVEEFRRNLGWNVRGIGKGFAGGLTAGGWSPDTGGSPGMAEAVSLPVTLAGLKGVGAVGEYSAGKLAAKFGLSAEQQKTLAAATTSALINAGFTEGHGLAQDKTAWEQVKAQLITAPFAVALGIGGARLGAILNELPAAARIPAKMAEGTGMITAYTMMPSAAYAKDPSEFLKSVEDSLPSNLIMGPAFGLMGAGKKGKPTERVVEARVRPLPPPPERAALMPPEGYIEPGGLGAVPPPRSPIPMPGPAPVPELPRPAPRGGAKAAEAGVSAAPEAVPGVRVFLKNGKSGVLIDERPGYPKMKVQIDGAEKPVYIDNKNVEVIRSAEEAGVSPKAPGAEEGAVEGAAGRLRVRDAAEDRLFAGKDEDAQAEIMADPAWERLIREEKIGFNPNVGIKSTHSYNRGGGDEIVVGTQGAPARDIKLAILHEMGHRVTLGEGTSNVERMKANEFVGIEADAWEWAIEKGRDYGVEITLADIKNLSASPRFTGDKVIFPEAQEAAGKGAEAQAQGEVATPARVTGGVKLTIPDQQRLQKIDEQIALLQSEKSYLNEKLAKSSGKVREEIELDLVDIQTDINNLQGQTNELYSASSTKYAPVAQAAAGKSVLVPKAAVTPKATAEAPASVAEAPAAKKAEAHAGEVTRTTSRKGTPEREALEAQGTANNERRNELYNVVDELKRQVSFAKYGSQKRTQLEKKLEKAQEALRQFDDTQKPLGEQLYRAHQEDLAESKNPVDSLKARINLKLAGQDEYANLKKRYTEEAVRQGYIAAEAADLFTEAYSYTIARSESMAENIRFHAERMEYKPQPATAIQPAPAPTAEEPAGKAKGGGTAGTSALRATVDLTMPRTATSAAPVEPVKASQIAKDLQDALVPIRTGRFLQRALGIYKVRPEVVRLRRANNLPVIAHEVGHHLQKLLFPGLTPKGNLSSKAFPREHWKELSSLAYPKAAKKVTEGYAEFIRLYLTDPAAAQQKAPQFYNFFTGKLTQYPEIMRTLGKAQKDIGRWIDQPAAARVRSTISRDEPSTGKDITFDRLYTMFVDSLHPLIQAEKAIAGGQKVEASKSPVVEAWRGRGIAGKAEAWLYHGRTDAKGKVIGKSLRDILSPVEAERDDFANYAVSRHGLDVIAAKGRDAMPLTKDDYAKVVSDAPAKYEAVLKDLVDFQDAALTELVDAGLLTPEAKATMRAKWPNHVPLYRVMEDTRGGGGVRRGQANQSSPIKRLKGSGRDIIDPIESIVKDIFTIMSVANRNRTMVKLVDLAEQFPGSGRYVEKVPIPKRITKTTIGEVLKVPETDPIWADIQNQTGISFDDPANIFRANITIPGKDNIVRIFRKGEAEFYQLDRDLFETVTGLDAANSSFWLRAMGAISGTLRAGATLTPEFALRNPLRDIQDALVLSRYHHDPVTLAGSWMRALGHVIGKTDLYYQWKALGGAHGSLVSIDRNYMQEALRKASRTTPSEKIIDAVKNPPAAAIGLMHVLSEGTEQITRLADFGKGTKWGREESLNNLLEATVGSRDVTIDFTRSGTEGKRMNAAVAFWNATIGGTDKVIREMKRRPVPTLGKALAYITLPTIALYLHNRKDKRYQELPEWQKDAFWIIFAGEHTIRIPRAHSLGMIFGAIPERALRALADKDPRAFDELAKNLWESLNPGIIPTAFLPLMQVYSNKTFTGTPIVPRREQGEPAQLQYGPQTSATAILLGRIFKVSPRMVDALAAGYGGGLGRYTMQGTGAVIEKTGAVKVPPRPAPLVTDLPVIRGFTVNEWGSPVQVDRLYHDVSRLNQLKQLAETKAGKPWTIEQEHKLVRLTRRTQALGGHRKLARQIQEATTMDEVRRYAPIVGNIVRLSSDIRVAKRDLLLAMEKQERPIAEGTDMALVARFRAYYYRRRTRIQP